MKKAKWFLQAFTGVALLGLLISIAGCATAGRINTGEQIVIGCTTFSEDAGSGRMQFPEYRIAAGDVLEVAYQLEGWKELDEFRLAVDNTLTVRFIHHPELDLTQHVRPDGNISLAFLGSVRVVGKTVEELTEELTEKYQEHLKEMDLYIVVDEFRESIKELKEDLRSTNRGSSRLVTVRPDGAVTFSMIGDLSVAGYTIPEISRILNEKYKAVLPGLSVDLFVEDNAGSKIYVFGEVNRPGAFQISRPTSIFEALALAGSTMNSARLDSAVVFRQKQNKVLATRIDLKKIIMPIKSRGKAKKRQPEKEVGTVDAMYQALQGGNPDSMEGSEYTQAYHDMFYLRPDDIVYIPRRRLNSAAEIVTEVSNILFFRGWNIGVSANN